jgi:ABC-type amino acid transport substrate-binding protein
MKRLFRTIVLCLAVAMAGCVAPHGGSDGSLDRPAIRRIEARGRLLVGSTGDYRPLTWHDPATGRWEGGCPQSP